MEVDEEVKNWWKKSWQHWRLLQKSSCIGIRFDEHASFSSDKHFTKSLLNWFGLSEATKKWPQTIFFYFYHGLKNLQSLSGQQASAMQPLVARVLLKRLFFHLS